MKDRKQMPAKDAGQIQPRNINILYDFAGWVKNAEFNVVFN
jgi:hypothetical protein